MWSAEAVGKVPKQILRRDTEKSDLIECATINDLRLGKGQVTRENVASTVKRTFSTGSLGATRMGVSAFCSKESLTTCQL